MSFQKYGGFRFAFRSYEDGYVYVYLARMGTMRGARPVARFKKEFLELDPELWQDIKDVFGRAITRETEAEHGLPSGFLRHAEESVDPGQEES